VANRKTHHLQNQICVGLVFFSLSIFHLGGDQVRRDGGGKLLPVKQQCCTILQVYGANRVGVEIVIELFAVVFFFQVARYFFIGNGLAVGAMASRRVSRNFGFVRRFCTTTPSFAISDFRSPQQHRYGLQSHGTNS
jgi:hypothetical protein